MGRKRVADMSSATQEPTQEAGTMTELKAQGGTVPLTQEQFYRLIQTPLRTRRHRLGLSTSTLEARTGFKYTSIEAMTGRAKRSDVNIWVSTLARILDALEYPITVETFKNVLSVGGSDLPAEIEKARRQLKPWRQDEELAALREVSKRQTVGEAEAEALAIAAHHSDVANGGNVPRSAVLNHEQAQKLFETMLVRCSTAVLIDELFRRESAESVALAVANRLGWVVVR